MLFTKYKTIGFIGLSLILHIALAVLLSQSMFDKPEIIKKVKPIQSYLVFAKPAPAPPPVVEPEPVVVSGSEPSSVPETANEPIKRVSAPEPQTTISRLTPAPTSKPSVEDSEPVKRSRYGRSSKKLTQRYIQELQAKEEMQVAQEEARRYQYEKKHPDLVAPAKDPFETEQDKIIKATTVTVNCEGTAAKTATIVSGLFGGTLKCNKRSEAERYIQDRLNKTAHLPGKAEKQK